MNCSFNESHCSCNIETSIAEASLIETGVWSVNRVVTKPSDGFKSRLLKKLQEIILQKDFLFKYMIVEPEGYSQDYIDLVDFYIENGFVEVKDSPGTYVWLGNRKINPTIDNIESLSTIDCLQEVCHVEV